MACLSSWSQMKVLFVTFVLLVIVQTISSAAYTGTRYGKRESTETIGRLFPRSSGVRNIQSRSSVSTRFYPGTRFGGKRAYWQPTPVLSEIIENSDSPTSNLPYECVHFPFVGIRCSRVEENYWNNNNNNDEEPGTLTNDAFESDGSGSPSLAAASAA